MLGLRSERSGAKRLLTLWSLNTVHKRRVLPFCLCIHTREMRHSLWMKTQLQLVDKAGEGRAGEGRERSSFWSAAGRGSELSFHLILSSASTAARSGTLGFFCHQSAQKDPPSFTTFSPQELPLGTAEGGDCFWITQQFTYELEVVDTLQLLPLCCRSGRVLDKLQMSELAVQMRSPLSLYGQWIRASGYPEFLGGFSLMIQRVSPHPMSSTTFKSSSLKGTKLGVNDWRVNKQSIKKEEKKNLWQSSEAHAGRLVHLTFGLRILVSVFTEYDYSSATEHKS